MGIQRRGDGGVTPGPELKHFTDREDEQAVFAWLVNQSAPDGRPMLMSYGVGGRGKSWLVKRLRVRLVDGSKLPSVIGDN